MAPSARARALVEPLRRRAVLEGDPSGAGVIGVRSAAPTDLEVGLRSGSLVTCAGGRRRRRRWSMTREHAAPCDQYNNIVLVKCVIVLLVFLVFLALLARFDFLVVIMFLACLMPVALSLSFCVPLPLSRGSTCTSYALSSSALLASVSQRYPYLNLSIPLQ